MYTHTYKRVNNHSFDKFNKLRGTNYQLVAINQVPVIDDEAFDAGGSQVALVVPDDKYLLMDDRGILGGNDINSIDIKWSQTSGILSIFEFKNDVHAMVANFFYTDEDGVNYEVYALLTDLGGHTLMQQLSTKVGVLTGKDANLLANTIASNLITSKLHKISTSNSVGYPGYKPSIESSYMTSGFKMFKLTNGSMDSFTIVYNKISISSLDDETIVEFSGTKKGQFMRLYYNIL